MSADAASPRKTVGAPKNAREAVEGARRDFRLYLSLSQELLKFISAEDIDEFLSLVDQRNELVERLKKNPATEAFRQTEECQGIVKEIKPLDMQLIYKAKSWLNKSRRKSAAVHSYELKTVSPVGNLFNKKF